MEARAGEGDATEGVAADAIERVRDNKRQSERRPHGVEAGASLGGGVAVKVEAALVVCPGRRSTSIPSTRRRRQQQLA